MKTSKKLSKRLITFMMSLLLLSYLNVIPVLAANVNFEDSIIASRTVIPSWGDHTVSGTPHYSSGFGIRDNQSVRLDVNIIYRTSDYPLSILVYTRDGVLVLRQQTSIQLEAILLISLVALILLLLTLEEEQSNLIIT